MYSPHNSGAFLLLSFVALFVLNSSDDNSKMLNDKNWFCSEESGFSETSDVVCILRYSGTKTNISFGECDSENISSPEATNVGPFGVRDLMNRLIDEALKTDELFKAGHQSLGDGSYSGYGLAQCTRDLNKTQCANCLKNLVEGPCGNNSLQAVPPFRMFSSSCYLRYASYPFIEQQPALSSMLSTPRTLFPSPSPAPAPSMSHPRTSPSRSGKMYTPFIFK